MTVCCRHCILAYGLAAGLEGSCNVAASLPRGHNLPCPDCVREHIAATSDSLPDEPDWPAIRDSGEPPRGWEP
jgi:hypothetical protein